jgi:very-short-patch-repair endonuclease
MDTERDPDDHLRALAEGQHGLITRGQAREAGLTRDAWRHRVARGDWQEMSPRVARRAGSAPTDEQRALAGVLDAGPGGLLTFPAAAALWGIPGYRLDPIHVATSRRNVRSTLATLHVPRMDVSPFVAELRGVPVVRPSLLLLQMAAVVHPERLGRHLDHLWSRRLVSGPSVRAEVDHLLHRGRPGTVALRTLLDSRPADYVPPASGLESRFLQIVADHDLPAMRAQVDLGDDEQWCGRVDFLAVDAPLVVEVDSERYHGSLSSTEDDARREARLVAAGFTVARVRDFEVWHRPAEVARRVRAKWWETRRAAA